METKTRARLLIGPVAVGLLAGGGVAPAVATAGPVPAKATVATATKISQVKKDDSAIQGAENVGEVAVGEPVGENEPDLPALAEQVPAATPTAAVASAVSAVANAAVVPVPQAAIVPTLAKVNVPAEQSSVVGKAIANLVVPAATVEPSDATVTYNATNLPAGLTFDPASRTISGTPTTVGTKVVTVRATLPGVTGATLTSTFTWKVQPVAVSNIAFPTAASRAVLTGQVLTFSPVIAPANATNQTITWSISNLGETGAKLTGNQLTATNAGTVTIKATIKDGLGIGADYVKEFPITVTKPFAAVTSVGFPAGGTTFVAGQTLTLNPSVAPATATNQTITWSIVNPGGTGAKLTGNKITATTAGSITVKATIANGLAVGTPYTRDINLIVSKPTIQVSAPRAQSSVAGQAISAITVPLATIDSASVAVTYKAVGLPAGLSFNPNTRVISGTPTKAGNYTVTIQASGGGATAASAFNWKVTEAAPKVVTGSFTSTVKGYPGRTLWMEVKEIANKVYSVTAGISKSGESSASYNALTPTTFKIGTSNGSGTFSNVQGQFVSGSGGSAASVTTNKGATGKAGWYVPASGKVTLISATWTAPSNSSDTINFFAQFSLPGTTWGSDTKTITGKK